MPADGIAVVCVDMLTKSFLTVDVDPGVMTGVDVCLLIDTKLDVALDMLTDTGIFSMDTPGISLNFVVETAYTGDALTNVSAVPKTDVVSGTNVVILANENANGLVAVMTSLESTLPSA